MYQLSDAKNSFPIPGRVHPDSRFYFLTFHKEPKRLKALNTSYNLCIK